MRRLGDLRRWVARDTMGRRRIASAWNKPETVDEAGLAGQRTGDGVNPVRPHQRGRDRAGDTNEATREVQRIRGCGFRG